MFRMYRIKENPKSIDSPEQIGFKDVDFKYPSSQVLNLSDIQCEHPSRRHTRDSRKDRKWEDDFH